MSNFKYSMLAIACATAFFSTNSMARTVTLTNGTGNGIQIGVTNVAEGELPNASGWGSIAIGLNGAVASQYNSVALGQKANASVEGGLALGSGSVADRAAGAFGVDSAGQALTGAVSFNGGTMTGTAWVSGEGALSIGGNKVDGGSQFTRQLTGLAAGSADTDAVNVAQLKSLKTYTDTQVSTVSNSVNAISQNTVFGAGTSTLITPEDSNDPNNVKPATYAQNAAILGNNAKVQMDNSVAIGANSIASTEGRTATVHLIPADADGAWKSEGLVSFGGTYQPVDEQGQPVGEPVNFNRQLTGVAAGSEDNDAVNVAQLKQLENNTAAQLNSLMTGETKVSTVQLTAVNEDGTPVEGGPTIGLRYQVASEAAQADGDPDAPTVSQGRLVYNNMDATGAVYGTETIATLSDGIKLSGGSTFAASGAAVDSVDVSLNQGISFLGDEYLQTTVTEGENGGAVVTVGASQALKDFLANSGVQPSEPTNPSNPGNSGNSGGTWTPNAAQQAALNGNFANGITVAAGEGNQAIQIKQGNVDMGGNRIQNVGNPINDGDAANKAYVDSTSRSLRNKINDVDKDLRAGVAMAMAVGNLPQAYMPGKSILAVSAGTYHGQGGFALGLSHATDNRQWVFKGAASVDTRGNFGGTLSAGYQF